MIDQQAQLKSWAEQRDALLNDIANKTTERDILAKRNKELGQSSGNLETKVNQLIGRLEELRKKEKEAEDMTSKEILMLTIKKTKLEAANENFEKHNNIQQLKLDSIKKQIRTLTDLHDRVFSRVGVLDKVLERVTRINAKNIEESNTLVSSLKENVEKVLDTTNKGADDIKKATAETISGLNNKRRK